MRCDEVTRELATPSDRRDDQALAEHLTHCEKCADWADRAEKLDRLWDATRPADPGPEAWASVWGAVNSALDAAAASQKAGRTGHARRPGQVAAQTTSGDARFWRGLAVMGTLALAQAAA